MLDAVNPFLDMTSRAALVVGAGQGIGRAASLYLARCGCQLALVDLERDRVEKVAGEIRELGQRAEPIVGDATSEPQVEELVGSAIKALGTDRLAREHHRDGRVGAVARA